MPYHLAIAHYKDVKLSIREIIPKLGYKDSNLEMTESESVALPFGDSPLTQRVYYTITSLVGQAFFT